MPVFVIVGAFALWAIERLWRWGATYGCLLWVRFFAYGEITALRLITQNCVLLFLGPIVSLCERDNLYRGE